MYDEVGISTWRVELDSYGKVKLNTGSSKAECPFRYQGQYEDVETGLYYNRFRYYSPEEGNYIQQDKIRLKGGFNLYAYVHAPNSFIDPLGLVGETQGGYSVYGLYNVDANGKAIGDPYYIGISNDVDRRAGEHIDSGRLSETDGKMVTLDKNITYGEVRGYEQAYIEHYETKTGTIGQDISETNRGNKINSFDHDNQTRDRNRQQYFEDAYDEKSKELNKGGCKK